MSEKKGIKEIKELLDGVEALVQVYKEVMKDGHVDFADLQALKNMTAKLDILKAAVEGAGEVVAEAKDLDLAEVGELVMDLLNKVSANK